MAAQNERDESNWISTRTACNLERVFVQLRKRVGEDVANANESTEFEFEIEDRGSNVDAPEYQTKFAVKKMSYDILELTGVDTFIRFDRHEDHISVVHWDEEKQTTLPLFNVHVSWDDLETRCRIRTEGEDITIPVISRKALKRIFFSE